MKLSQSQTYRIALDQIRQYRATIVLSILLILLATVLDVLSPLLFRYLIDDAIGSRNFGLIASVIAGMVLLPFASSGLSILEGHQRSKIGTAVTQALRQRAFEHTLSVQMRDLEQYDSGALFQRLTRSGGQVGDVLIGDNLLPLIPKVLFLVGNVVAMFITSWRLALATLLAVPLLFGAGWLVRKRVESLDERLYYLLESSSNMIHETLAGLRAIRAFNGRQREETRWQAWSQQYWESKLASSALHGFLVYTLSSFLNNLVYAVVLGFGAYEIIGNRLSIGSLVAFLVYAPRVLSALQQLSRTHLSIAEVRAAITKLDEHFALPIERTDGSALPQKPNRNQGMEVVFDNVSFAYGRGEAGIKELSFKIRAGEFVGIVGPSGGGKSTIFDLLMGLYEPDSGQILLDGTEMQELSLAAIRAEIGVVPQETFLWNASLSENLTYPKEPAQLGAEVERVVQAAQLQPFVASLPDGLQTMVGERGLALSGGERQRVAIARALLRNPRLLLLDEATSALDPLTEVNLRDSFEALRYGRTTIVIAHRMTTVARADRIIVVDKGGVVESGSPEALLAQKGLYHSFHQAQMATKSE
ncbi:MAG: ABC transporter ATP-binding protein [Ardenticatenaceae bacterium]|nr:ABC transporter ATP-binding protein [Ardenticatenaceae bacterium]